MKRVLCMLLTLAMLATLLCGCGSKQSKGGGDNADEEVTLVIAIPAAEQKDTVKVVDAINEKLKDLLPNTKVKFLMDASMAEKWPLWMSTQKPIDIAHSGYVAVLEEEVSKKSSQDVAANSIPTPIIVYNIFFIVTCFLIIRLQIKIQHSNPP